MTGEGFTWANRGVDVEVDHLLWYEQLGAVAYASGAASTQSFEEFLATGPPMDGVPDDVVAALRTILTRDAPSANA